MNNTPTIEAKGLHAYYDTSHVLHGIDLTVGQGEIVSFMGRNGMGKTTTLRALVGLIRPRQGTVFVHGINLTGAPAHQIALAGIAMVPEGGGIFPKLTAYENLVMAARPGRDGKARWTLEDVLELLPRLSERLRNMGGNLSGGERQMLAIGRALMTNPDLLILDEATEGLAPLVRQDIWATIRRLRAGGIAVLVVDKDINTLATIADRCIVIAKGRIVYSGTPAALAAERDIMVRHLSV
jgi:branched-chain amino acid transport system ATP-binding protein